MISHPWLEKSECCNHWPDDWDWVIRGMLEQIEADFKWVEVDTSILHISQVKEKFGHLRVYWEFRLDCGEYYEKSIKELSHKIEKNIAWAQGACYAIEKLNGGKHV
jgi:hypothetical protein